jgi:hypothetical protein
MSMKKSSDTIGNRTHDLPVCSAAPEPLRHQQHAPQTHEYLLHFSSPYIITTIT